MIEPKQPQTFLVARALRRYEQFCGKGVAFIILLPRGMMRFFGRGHLAAALRESKRLGGAEVLETGAPGTRDAVIGWARQCEFSQSKGVN